MAQKRVSRARKRDLEQPDEFLTLTARLLEKARVFWKPLSACGLVLFVILAGVLVAGYFSDRAEEKAFVLLNQAMIRYGTEGGGPDRAKALAAVAPDFDTLFANYGRRQGGAAARLIFAQMNILAGRPEAAVDHYKQALEIYPEGSYAASAAKSGLGYAQAASGQHEKAIAAFADLIAGQDSIFKADALYQLTVLYRQTGQEDEYQKALQTLQKDYPQFIYADMLTGVAGG